MPAVEKTSKPSTAQTNHATKFFGRDGNAFFNQTQPPFFHPIQAKLEVSQPNDPQELEADKLADKVMRSDQSTH